MPTVAATRTVIDSSFSNYVIRTWEGILSGDTCTGDLIPPLGDRSVQVIGTFSTATIAIHGSLNGVDYSVLTDPQGNALSFTATKIEQIMELVPYLKPVITSGDGSTDVDVIICVKGVQS